MCWLTTLHVSSTSWTWSHRVAELHHLGDDLLVDVGEDGVSDELHVSAGQLVHEHLERGEQQVKIKTS